MILALNDPDPFVRGNAAESLGLLSPKPTQAVPALLRALRDPDVLVRSRAGEALTSVGSDAKEAIPEFLAELKSKDPELRARASQALGRTGPNAKDSIPDFISALKDASSDVRMYAAVDLGRMGEQASGAVPALISSLKDSVPKVRMQAAASLGAIGPNANVAAPALLAALKDPDSDVKGTAALALCEISSNQASAVPSVVTMLKGPGGRYGYWAAQVFGRLGPVAADSIPDLLSALQSPDESVRNNIATALVVISDFARDRKQVQIIPLLEHAVKSLRSTHFASQLRIVETDVALLSAIQPPWYQPLYRSFSKRPYVTLLVFAYPLLTLGCLAVLWISPFSLWRLNSISIFSRQIKPTWMGGVEVSLAHMLVFGCFRYHHRILDAWVGRHLVHVRDRFGGLPTVKQREIRVSVPATLDGIPIAELKPNDLRKPFNAPQTCLLVWGEGGLGKTSLACQIARWAMSQEGDLRPMKHPMLPVIVEQDLDLPSSGNKNILLEVVRGWLKYLTDQIEPPQPEFVRQLLKQKRLLLIVDGLSEMSEATRSKIRPIDPDFDANALVVTSRLEERLDMAVSATIHPERIRGDRLASFISAYMSHSGKQDLLTDSEFFDGCKQLSNILNGNEATVLLAKLFADHMIAIKEGRASEVVPKNIPDLMLDYLNLLNRQDPEQNHRAVQSNVKFIAWECLRQNFRPIPASFQRISVALGDGAEQRIRYLESKLRIIETVGSDHNQIRFVLDPLAEYMAGLHVIEDCADSKTKWRQLLRQIDSVGDDFRSRRGFVVALRDCYLAKRQELNIPRFVDDELAKRITNTAESNSEK